VQCFTHATWCPVSSRQNCILAYVCVEILCCPLLTDRLDISPVETEMVETENDKLIPRLDLLLAAVFAADYC